MLFAYKAIVDECDICRYKALGVRLDSGDLSYLSVETRRFFKTIEEELNIPGFGKLVITASNDINEETLDALNKQVLVVTDWLQPVR